MKNKIININKDFIKKKKFLKKEIKKIILLSIIQNLNLKPYIRGVAMKKICKFNKKSRISNQNNNICLNTGRIKGVLRKTQSSRHFTKKLGFFGFLQNFKINSW